MKMYNIVLELKDNIYKSMRYSNKAFCSQIEFSVVANSMEEAHNEIKSFNYTDFDINISEELYEVD